ncbi:MAG: Coenzyme F420 hydrogenase/dehydrogenase, beta subunit C-terminal domain [Methanoregula sp.]|nr:Coenzyme F420 hydrogenase/dehydrogenase, beta subunit C-terminal domain [Methanoregula sp.]
MAKKGDMLYAWTNDADIKKKAELGGAVTALWKHALESKTVDAVFAIKKGKDLYDAQPVLITDPRELAQTAGSLHCGTLLLPKLVKKYLDGAKTKKIGVTVKGCDVMGFIELAKRKQINLDNIVMIGVNCGGSVSPMLARRMIADKFGVDPDKVHKEEIDKGQFIIEYEGGHKGISMDELEEAGYGRRSNCRRCKMKIPRQADLACGNWGVIGDKAGKATFVEVCSEKGANLLNGAVKSGILATEAANPKGLEIRGKVEGAMMKLGDKWRRHDFTALGANLWETINKETSRCIKCYSCIENCPVCFTAAEDLKKGSLMVKPGELPPNPMFHLRRFAHISDTCINCGQCEELCPMEIPMALFSHAIRAEGDAAFEAKLGKAAYTN